MWGLNGAKRNKLNDSIKRIKKNEVKEPVKVEKKVGKRFPETKLNKKMKNFRTWREFEIVGGPTWILRPTSSLLCIRWIFCLVMASPSLVSYPMALLFVAPLLQQAIGESIMKFHGRRPRKFRFEFPFEETELETKLDIMV
jgi:hypothetical protein